MAARTMRGSLPATFTSTISLLGLLVLITAAATCSCSSSAAAATTAAPPPPPDSREAAAAPPRNRIEDFVNNMYQRLTNFLQKRLPSTILRSPAAKNDENRRQDTQDPNKEQEQKQQQQQAAAPPYPDPTKINYKDVQPEDPFAAHLHNDRPTAAANNNPQSAGATPSHQVTDATATDEANENKYAGSPRLFSFFSPYNPLNPFQKLFDEVQNKDSLLRKMLKIPVVATASIARPGQAAGTGGTVEFLQTKDKKSIQAVVAFSLPSPAFVAGPYRLEVRSGQSTVCANAGTVYNPVGVVDGGVLARAVTGTLNAGAGTVQGSGYFTVDPLKATLYGLATIIGKTVAIVDSAGTEACGIVAAA